MKKLSEKAKRRISNILGYIIIIGFLIGIIAVIAMFAGALMGFLGFKYESVGSLVLYFIIISAVGFPLDVVSQALPKALLGLGKVDKKTARILFVALDSLCTFAVMFAIDYFMDSVTATYLSMIVVSIIFAIISIDRDKL